MDSVIGIIFIAIAVFALAAMSFLLFGQLTARDRTTLVQPHQRIEVDGRTRKYRFYSPDPDKSLPVVVMLHGYNYDSGRISELYSGWSNLADETGEFAIVYPEGVGRSWNGDFCCGLAYQRGIDDVKFIDKMLEQINHAHNINQKQQYIVGFSNGSFLAQRLLSEKPDLFVAGAAVMTGVGEDGGGRLDISGATAPLVIVTGAQDSYTNHNLNKRGFRFTDADETLTAWSSQLTVSPASTSSGDNYKQTAYAGSDGQVKLLYRLYDQQHRWPQWRLWLFADEVSPFTSDVWQQLQLLAQKG